ncbi:hypothetical protein [Frigoribacterium sp. PhB24]|uniref:hypothetical protein n=1 Tax=Frigoribacterium sp. PhB24 TaxID=2485204 RepID=UPI000F4A6D4C|nr:hypothetical protein [Frigoribacterium sp. PhB24]ROS50495.1 hypothetical protein EDF50_2287 [Frigoribacterium sp. PhB24]
MSGAGYVGRTVGTVAASYSIVVPPGFVRVPGEMTAPDAAAFVAAQLGDPPAPGTATAPDDWRLRFGSALGRALAADGHGRVMDSYLSGGPLPGTDIVCSIVVATVPVTRSEHADLDRLLLRRVATQGANPIVLAEDPAVVWDDSGGAFAPGSRNARLDGPRALTPLRRRTVLARIAGHDDRLISLVLTVGSATPDAPDEGDADAQARVVGALTDVFDAMLSTFRWRDAGGRLVTDRPLA